MNELPKVGTDKLITPLPPRSPLAEIYSRRPYDELNQRVPEDAQPRSEGSVEEGKGQYVDIYV